MEALTQQNMPKTGISSPSTCTFDVGSTHILLVASMGAGGVVKQ